MAANFKKIKKILLVSALIIPLGFVAYLFFSNLSFSYKNLLPEKGEKIKLYPYKSLKYQFKSGDNNLSAIKLLLESDELIRGDKIKVEIKNASCDLVIREKTLGPLALDSQIFANFNFEKISDSGGKDYCLEITYLSKQSKTKKILYVYLSQNADFPGEAVTDTHSGKEYANYSLLLKTAYQKDSIWQNLEELDKRISQYKPFFLKKYYLASIVIAFLVLSLTLVILLISL